MPAIITLTTAERRTDALTAADYRDIYQELRGKMTLEKFIALTGSQRSRSFWAQYEAGAKALDWQRRNELRRAVGLPKLAPPVADALAAADDATVWQLGALPANRVLLVGRDLPHALTIGLNGGVHIDTQVLPVAPATGRVTPITRHPRVTVGIGGIAPATRSALAAARQPGETWDALLRRAVQALAAQP